MGGAWLGTWIAPLIQHVLFGVLLLVVSIWTWRAPLYEFSPPTNTCHCIAALLVGGGLGILTGLLGVGGGFLMVPALIALGISHFPTAVAHSLLLIIVNATTSGITYTLGHITVSSQTMIIVGLLAAAGSIIGSRLLHYIPPAPLQRGFSLGLALLGIAMLMQLMIA